MKIAMGILAYNEERTIGSTISSLAEQSVFENPNHTISIHVVPNGCRDATALLAREALESLKKRHPSVQVEVNELTEGGKANAWNHFVHEFSPADAEGLLLLDADIHFGEPECLERVVKTLMESPAAVVAVDLPLKDIALKKKPSVRERLSVNASHLQVTGTPKIAGSLYFVRADALRSFWMPLGLLVEDGFVKAMLLTDSFRHPEIAEGIVRAPEATHYFKAVTGLKDWFSHERRLLNGTALNILLFSYIQQLIRDGEDPNWGRILAAIGTTSATFDPYRIDVNLNGVQVCTDSSPGADRDLVDMSGEIIEIVIDLNMGSESATIMTNDLTAMYVHENSAYAT